MPDGPYVTPDEETLLRMIRNAGSPQSAGASLIDRLAALEAAVAALEESLPPVEETSPCEQQKRE
jgi:hypothetical protein